MSALQAETAELDGAYGMATEGLAAMIQNIGIDDGDGGLFCKVTYNHPELGPVSGILSTLGGNTFLGGNAFGLHIGATGSNGEQEVFGVNSIHFNSGVSASKAATTNYKGQVVYSVGRITDKFGYTPTDYRNNSRGK